MNTAAPLQDTPQPPFTMHHYNMGSGVRRLHCLETDSNFHLSSNSPSSTKTTDLLTVQILKTSCQQQFDVVKQSNLLLISRQQQCSRAKQSHLMSTSRQWLLTTVAAQPEATEITGGHRVQYSAAAAGTAIAAAAVWRSSSMQTEEACR